MQLKNEPRVSFFLTQIKSLIYKNVLKSRTVANARPLQMDGHGKNSVFLT